MEYILCRTNGVMIIIIMLKTTTLLLLLLLLFSHLPYSTIHLRALAQPSNNISSTFLTYEDPELGLKMQYPSNWVRQQANLLRHTIVAFQLQQEIFRNTYDFANITLAEVDLRVYNAPQNETSAKLNIGQIDTGGDVIVSHYKSNNTTLGGLPALKITNYFVGVPTEKGMQVWTFVPNKHVLVELLYVAQPSQYSLYLPIVQKMIDSVKIIH